MKMRLEAACRVCLTEKGSLKPLFSTKCSVNGTKVPCHEMLLYCTSNPVKYEDNFPKQICSNCVHKLLTSFKFKKLCEQSCMDVVKHLAEERQPECVFKDTADTSNVERSTLLDALSEHHLQSDRYLGNIKSEDTFCDANDAFGLADYDAGNVEFVTSHNELDGADVKLEDDKRKSTKFSYFCDICQKSYKDEEVHKARSHSSPGVGQCEVCAAVFQKPYSLLLHLRRHSQDLPCACPHPGCSKAFPIPSMLKQHAKSHTKDRPFICHYCSHAARSKQQLLIHIRYHHTKEKCYQCSFCEKAFVSYQARYNHEKRHKNIRDHHCQLCEKTFVSSSGLVFHMLTHTGERNFGCRLCPSRFGRKAHRNKHENRVHGVATPQPNMTA